MLLMRNNTFTYSVVGHGVREVEILFSGNIFKSHRIVDAKQIVRIFIDNTRKVKKQEVSQTGSRAKPSNLFIYLLKLGRRQICFRSVSRLFSSFKINVPVRTRLVGFKA